MININGLNIFFIRGGLYMTTVKFTGIFRIIIVLFFVSLLSGCGGGGGGGGGVDVDNEENTTPPPVPTGLKATVISASEIDLSWDASDNAVGYNIYRNGNSTALANIYGKTTYSDTNLTANTTYSYTVAAYNTNGNESAQSAPVSTKTIGTATILSGTGSSDYGRGVAVDSSGDIYVTGWTAGNLYGISNPNHTDVFLSKYNSSGIRQWTKLLGTTGVVDPDPDTFPPDMGNYGLNVAVDSTYVYVTGYTTTGINGAGAIGGRDIFLVRYNKLNGDGKSSKIMGTTSDDAGNSVAVDGSGNVYIAGYTEGEMGGAGTHIGGKDIILLKYNSSLVQQWVKQIGSIGDDVATGVAVSASGNKVAITGQAGGSFSFFANEPGWDYLGGVSVLFVARFDSAGLNGSLVFRGSSSKTDPNWTEKTTAGLAIAIYNDAYVAVTGITNGVFGASNNGGYDAVVAYLNLTSFTDPTGRWIQQIGTADDDVAYGITMDSDPGNVYVTGFTGGSWPPFFTNKGEEDIFLARFGFGGTLFSVTLAGTTGDDEGRAIAIDSSNANLYIAGFTNGNLDGFSNAGGYDMCLLKFGMDGKQQ
jgi:hypothetical protein